jgi:tRNA-Thr(GGU) m(6)t(6)A37 methyltransferase TsaA
MAAGPSFEVVPVGVVASPHRDPDSVPGGGAPAQIRIFPERAAALDGIESSTHLFVLAFLPGVRRDLLSVTGRGAAAGPPRGVFATRCASRPNPIALTVVRLLSRDGNVLRVDGLDLADGTPVLDLKPYVPGQDAVLSARRARTVRLARMEPVEALGYLEPELEHHLGELARTPPARAALAAILVATRRLSIEARDEGLRVSVNRADATVDALLGLTGATFGSGRLAIDPAPGPLAFRFEHAGRTLRLVETPRLGEAILDPARLADAAFDVTPP